MIRPLDGVSDSIGRKPVMIAGAAGMVVFSYPLFTLLHARSIP